jgi:hypothetical protein
MTAAIPVILDLQKFPSQNKARIHFSEMLHRYEPGQTITAEDRIELEDLIKHHPLHDPTKPIAHIAVTKGSFNRTCFEAVKADQSKQALSIMPCIRNTPTPDQARSPILEEKKKAESTVEAEAPPKTQPAKLRKKESA